MKNLDYMTPKEEAIELMLKYYKLIPMGTKSFAKQCALIAIRRLIQETGSKYWYNVKKEMENL
jgi:hypothetical protein